MTSVRDYLDSIRQSLRDIEELAISTRQIDRPPRGATYKLLCAADTAANDAAEGVSLECSNHERFTD